MRWYEIMCCRDATEGLIPHTELASQIVEAPSIEHACLTVRALGWWPAWVLRSAWNRDQLDAITTVQVEHLFN